MLTRNLMTFIRSKAERKTSPDKIHNSHQLARKFECCPRVRERAGQECL